MQAPDVLPNLIRQMNDISLRYDIKKTLIAEGESVEEHILAAFDELTDRQVRRDLIEILQKVGTQKSIPMLNDLADGADFSLQSSAERAIDAINSRK